MAAGRGVKVLGGMAAVGIATAAGLYWVTQRTPGPAPDFVLPDLQGRAVRLSALRGKVVLVNLWTTWCPPCRDEMPSMERLYQRLGARGLELLAVSEDEGGGAPVAAFARELGLSFPVLLDPDRLVGGRYGVWGYPETFVIDRSGRIAERVIGPRHWDTPESVAALERLLASGDGTPEPAAAAP